MSDEWAGLEADARRATDARRDRQYNPAVEYRAGEVSEVAIPLQQVPVDEAAWRVEITRVTGLTVPDERKIELAQVRYWGDPESPNVYCRFLVTDRESKDATADAVELLRELRENSHNRSAVKFPAGESSLCVSWNDWQVAKKEGGGTPALAARLDSAFSATIERAKELRTIGRDLGELVIIGGGDIVEGCQIFANQSFEIDDDRRGQIRNAVTFALEGLDRIAPMFSAVRVLVVGGNHGENRIGGKRTTRHDNDDCAVFEHVALAASRDDRLAHVKFYIAQDEPAKTLKVGPWILGTTHGQAFARGSGGVAQKAHRWFSGQAAGRHPVGDADLLVTHHYHHFAAQDWGAAQWVQTPAMDGGSSHFTDQTGMHSKPGMLTWVMSPQSRFTDPQIL